MRWVVIACSACGRLAFDEVAQVAPDAPSDAAVRCTLQSFDQEPEGFTRYGIGSYEIADGVITFSIPGTFGGDIGLESTDARSFVGRTTAIQVVSPSLTQSASTAFGWHDQNGERIGIHMEMDGFSLKLNQFNPTTMEYIEHVAMPYDAVEFAWWRLRDIGPEVRSEVSRDGVAWHTFGSVSGFDLSSMKWDVGMGSYNTNVAPSESTIDNASDCDP